MNTPLYSAEEAERLAALASYHILDSLPEQDYDGVANTIGVYPPRKPYNILLIN